MANQSGWLRALGPGVLFTGAAVGVSHLVQSTRAGAVYGFALVGLVIVAHLTKYPAFRFGPLYAAATGRSMLQGYRRQGRWALALYAVLTVGTMFTVQAGVTIVTAGLAIALFGLPFDVTVVSGALVLLCVALVLSGGYRALDGVAKAIVGVLAVCTLAATALVLPRVGWAGSVWLPTRFEAADVAFMVALVGWMPSAIDVSVWQSLWTVARARQTGAAPTDAESSLDFHIGYVSTAALALCFVVLGAGVMHGPDVSIAAGAGAFAAQIIDLYAAALGDWSRPVIGGAAFATMLSTTLTVVDGFPRAISVLAERFTADEPEAETRARERTPVYLATLGALGVGSLLLIARFRGAMPPLLDLAATLSFLSAPLLSWLNHRAVTSDDVPPARRPGRGLLAASWVCVAFQGAFAIAYLGLWVQRTASG